MCLPWLLRVTENKGSTPEREPEKRLPHPRKAAGAQITHSRHEEVVTKNNEAVLYEARYRNEYNLNLLTRTNWRASLVNTTVSALLTPEIVGPGGVTHW